MSSDIHNQKELKASRHIREILVARKISITLFCKLINETGHKISRPTIYKRIANPLTMDHEESTVVAGVLGVSTETMDAILRGEDIVTTVSVSIEKKVG